MKEKRFSWYAISKRQGDLKFDLALIVFMVIMTVIFFYPVYMVIISAVSSPEAIYNGEVLLLPSGFNTQGFQLVLESTELWCGHLNSAFYTVVGTAISLFCTLTGAYVLAQPSFGLKKVFTYMIIITMFVSGGMIPTYLLVRDLGLLNKVWAVTLPTAISTWNLMMTRTFLQSTIPNELREAAELDGCNDIQFFWRIVLPLSVTIIAVMGMFYGINYWNEFFNSLLYITDESKFPLQLVLRDLLLNSDFTMGAVQDTGFYDPYNQQQLMEMYQLAESMKYVVTLITVLPIVIIFPFVEKYLTKGVMVGSLKG